MCGERFILKHRAQVVWAVLVLALLLRIAWAVAVPVVPVSDGTAYDLFAQNLVRGLGFGFQAGEPTAHWPPGVSAVYALFYMSVGHTYLPIVLLNIVLGVFMVAAAMQLAAWWYNPYVSVITGFLLALWLNLIEFTTLLASEQLFCALLLGALLVWEHPGWSRTRRAPGAGVLLALACYMRPAGLALPVVFVILEWLRIRRTQLRPFASVLIAGALLLLAMAVVIVPWTVRNVLTFGRVILISDNAGQVFWSGNNPAADGASIVPVPESALVKTADPYTDLNGQLLGYAGAHPLAFAAGILQKLVLTHSRESIGVVWNEVGLTARWGAGVLLPLKAVNAVYWYIVLALALAGMALVIRAGWLELGAQPPFWVWAYFALVAAVFLGQDRYHIPSNPAIAMFAASALVHFYKPLRVAAPQSRFDAGVGVSAS